jgi:hypothetical protein
MLYFILPPPVLLALGWDYVGGGSEITKIHPATYLLFAGLTTSSIIDRGFLRRIVARLDQDPCLLSFVIAVTLTAAYCCFMQGASLAPFVDTFLAAIVVAIILSCIPFGPLSLLRRLVDLFFVINILLIFVEASLQKNLLAPYLWDVSRTPQVLHILSQREVEDIFSRADALFGGPLTAAALLGAYSITNLVSTPMRFSRSAIWRLVISLLSYLAVFPTGGRSAMVVTTVLLAGYFVYSAFRAGLLGYVNKAGLTFSVSIALLGIPFSLVLWDLGFFDSMLDRFQYDYGSALSRDYAIQILQQASAPDLWLGRPVQEITALQQSFGLSAIELAWINFVLVGGLITALPLFITYTLFLFRSLRLYCRAEIYYVSLFTLVITGTNNGIWAKTSTLTSILVVAISFLRRDMKTSKAFIQKRQLVTGLARRLITIRDPSIRHDYP